MSIYRGGKIVFSTIALKKQLFGGDFFDYNSGILLIAWLTPNPSDLR